jgi:polyisoprenyl-teichoic acid--peptidoglycan teichoic acid transferase
MAKRFALAGVSIIMLSGAATYMLVRGEVSTVLSALAQNKPVEVTQSVLAPASTGEPQTLLLVGNDERPPPKDNPQGAVVPHSNEMLLVRIDPSKPTISMLSIPRELQVTFTAPNGEVITNRINSAFTDGFEEDGGTSGGVKLMLETIKRVMGVTVNHVFITNFPKFKQAVDEMGCVYMTVDKRYYHHNEPEGEQYFEINLQPGYQRLCGEHALQFVANRHESTSIVRDARDQRFLLAAKAQYGPTLFGNREKFERILGKAVETDLHGEEAVLQLVELLVQSAGKPVRQVPFQVELHSNYDTATPQQIEASVHSFMNGTAPIPKHKLNKAVRSVHVYHRAPSTLSLAPTPSATIEEARALAVRLPFALEAPRYQATTAEAAPDLLRRYDIRDQQGQLHPIYTIVVDKGELGQYYDVQGSAWADPPLLGDPSQQIHIGSRTYNLFYDGEHIKTIAWHERNAVYWIENTLNYGLSPQTIVAIARVTRPVGNAELPTSATSASPHVVPLPLPGSAATSQTSKLVLLLSFISLLTLAILGMVALARRRELILLRAQVPHALALEARQRRLVAVASAIPQAHPPQAHPPHAHPPQAHPPHAHPPHDHPPHDHPPHAHPPQADPPPSES